MAKSNSNGEWSNQNCHLLNISSDRKLYAMAIDPANKDTVVKLYKECGNRMHPSLFQTIVQKNGIQSVGLEIYRFIEFVKPVSVWGLCI